MSHYSPIQICCCKGLLCWHLHFLQQATRKKIDAKCCPFCPNLLLSLLFLYIVMEGSVGFKKYIKSNNGYVWKGEHAYITSKTFE